VPTLSLFDVRQGLCCFNSKVRELILLRNTEGIMAQTKRTQAHSSKNGDSNGEIADTIRGSFEASFRAAIALQEELMSFATHRIQENASVSEALLKCRNWEDAFRMQQDWARSTAEEYLQESGKFMELTRQAVQVGIAPFIRAAEKVQGASER
jgi:hypothetical protein